MKRTILVCAAVLTLSVCDGQKKAPSEDKGSEWLSSLFESGEEKSDQGDAVEAEAATDRQAELQKILGVQKKRLGYDNYQEACEHHDYAAAEKILAKMSNRVQEMKESVFTPKKKHRVAEEGLEEAAYDVKHHADEYCEKLVKTARKRHAVSYTCSVKRVMNSQLTG